MSGRLKIWDDSAIVIYGITKNPTTGWLWSTQSREVSENSDLVHKDFHSGNIVNRFYITDFGLCKPVSQDSNSKRLFGVLPYMLQKPTAEELVNTLYQFFYNLEDEEIELYKQVKNIKDLDKISL
ncbi:hypothetical protein C2G38_2186574 [Gigaspora rosea]|uniref:Protein kinase domain-containing protein n=1 Tax=Gigaspora rosea TaxID=44941 RepID=A0A397V6N6_9GLOM|nr:hypothetical protein C2G38_2186574 [Gigaspora rosea]